MDESIPHVAPIWTAMESPDSFPNQSDCRPSA
jgi:hypothetical protein